MKGACSGGRRGVLQEHISPNQMKRRRREREDVRAATNAERSFLLTSCLHPVSTAAGCSLRFRGSAMPHRQPSNTSSRHLWQSACVRQRQQRQRQQHSLSNAGARECCVLRFQSRSGFSLSSYTRLARDCGLDCSCSCCRREVRQREPHTRINSSRKSRSSRQGGRQSAPSQCV